MAPTVDAMNDVDLGDELRRLVRLFRDATGEYEKRLAASGETALADEWRYNVGDLLGDVRSIGEDLANAYVAAPEEIPVAMKRFVTGSLHGPDFHTRGHITRLGDALEGRPPSWPEDTGESPAEVVEGLKRIFAEPQGVVALYAEWCHVLWRLQNATDGYVYGLRAAGMEDLADVWQRAVSKFLQEGMHGGDALTGAYLSPPEQLPHRLRAFFEIALHAAGTSCRDLLARLSDAVHDDCKSFPGAPR